MSTLIEPKPAAAGNGEPFWPDVLACERAVLRFTAAFDVADLDAMLAEFDRDGVWQRQDGTLHGHDELRAMMAARPPGRQVRHVVTNLRVVMTGQDAARCTSYVTVYRYDHGPASPAPLDAPALVGTYHDVLRRSGQRWWLTHRSVTVDFKRG